MRRTLVQIAAVTVTVFMLALPIQAATITFTASLSGLQEVGPNASPATGLGTVVLDDVANTITVDLSWSGLTAPATAAHIHGPAAVGVNAPVLFPFSGVPAATAGSIPEQTFFGTTPTEIAQLEATLFYFNIHTSTFPGGEIRGQISAVPEPTTMFLLGSGLIGLWGARRKLKK